MIPEYFFAIVAFIYFLIHLLLRKGLHNSLTLKKNSGNLPFVSVIVAGRNESANIGKCVESLKKIIYPDEKIEILIVDDHSTDDTLQIMNETAAGDPRFRIIQSREGSTGNLKGKANAIDTAIELCKGEVIVSTDADCIVQPEWVKETVKYYSKDTGMVCGFTEIKTDNTLFSKLQSLDWMYLLTLASSSAGIKMILSCLGNNLSFAKKAYERTGGYSSIDFSVTEDLALMRKIDAVKDLEVLYPVDDKCLVTTYPCQDLKELFSQKRRWFKGGIGINFLGYIIGFELYAVNIAVVSGWTFLNYKTYLFIVFVKVISELMLLSKTLSIFKMTRLYKYYPAFILYFAFYGLILPFSFLFSKNIRWKDRKF